VHDALTPPARHDLSARSAQSVRSVPARTRTPLHCSAPKPARRCTPNMTPPLPSALEHARDPTEPETDRTPTKTAHVASETSSHRRHRLEPWTQPTVPPQHAAYDAQSHPMKFTINRVYLDGIKPATPFLSLPLLLICSHLSPLSLPPLSAVKPHQVHRRRARGSGRSPTTMVEVAVDLADLSAPSLVHGVPLPSPRSHSATFASRTSCGR
jgi:hypothetical protein